LRFACAAAVLPGSIIDATVNTVPARKPLA
jgi:hypothetical protein